MIIYGYRNRETELGTGTFYCSKCEVQRPYRHKKLVRYFTLFFIPLFPLGTLSEYVECQVCGRAYTKDILQAASTTSTPIAETDRYIGSQNQPAPANVQRAGQKNSCLPLLMAAAGALSILGGLTMGVALIATQMDPANQNMASFILAVLCCPTPMVLLGLLTIGGGIYLLRSKESPS